MIERRAKHLGEHYVWRQLDSCRWSCRRTHWTGRPTDFFIGIGANPDEAYADLQRQRAACVTTDTSAVTEMSGTCSGGMASV